MIEKNTKSSTDTTVDKTHKKRATTRKERRMMKLNKSKSTIDNQCSALQATTAEDACKQEERVQEVVEHTNVDDAYAKTACEKDSKDDMTHVHTNVDAATTACNDDKKADAVETDVFVVEANKSDAMTEANVCNELTNDTKQKAETTQKATTVTEKQKDDGNIVIINYNISTYNSIGDKFEHGLETCEIKPPDTYKDTATNDSNDTVYEDVIDNIRSEDTNSVDMPADTNTDAQIPTTSFADTQQRNKACQYLRQGTTQDTDVTQEKESHNTNKDAADTNGNTALDMAYIISAIGCNLDMNDAMAINPAPAKLFDDAKPTPAKKVEQQKVEEVDDFERYDPAKIEIRNATAYLENERNESNEHDDFEALVRQDDTAKTFSYTAERWYSEATEAWLQETYELYKKKLEEEEKNKLAGIHVEEKTPEEMQADAFEAMDYERSRKKRIVAVPTISTFVEVVQRDTDVQDDKVQSDNMQDDNTYKNDNEQDIVTKNDDVQDDNKQVCTENTTNNKQIVYNVQINSADLDDKAKTGKATKDNAKETSSKEDEQQISESKQAKELDTKNVQQIVQTLEKDSRAYAQTESNAKNNQCIAQQNLNTNGCFVTYNIGQKKQNIDEMIKNSKKLVYKPIISSELEERLNKQRAKIQRHEANDATSTYDKIAEEYAIAEDKHVKKIFFCKNQIIQNETVCKEKIAEQKAEEVQEPVCVTNTSCTAEASKILPQCNVNMVDLSGKGKVNITILQYQTNTYDINKSQDSTEEDSADKEQKRVLEQKRAEVKLKIEERKMFIKQHQRSLTLKNFPSTVDVRYIDAKKQDKNKKSRLKAFIDKIFRKA